MDRETKLYVGLILLAGLASTLLWVGFSYFEAKAYNEIVYNEWVRHSMMEGRSYLGMAPAPITTWQAMFVQLRIGEIRTTRQQAEGPTFPTALFGQLADAPAGMIIFCVDCSATSPCSGVGSGALAKRIDGAWFCN